MIPTLYAMPCATLLEHGLPVNWTRHIKRLLLWVEVVEDNKFLQRVNSSRWYIKMTSCNATPVNADNATNGIPFAGA